MAGFGSRWLRCPTPLPTLGFLLAREPIFSETHTNEFCGIRKSTPEPAGSWAPLRPGRWVYEGKEKKAPVGGMSSRLGTSPRQPSQAAVGPISYFAALAWCPTVCRGTDDFGEHHPSTAAALALRPGEGAASGKTPSRRKGIPHVRRGVGSVGAWPMARPLLSHRGYLPVGEASGLNLPVGPPLGALRRRSRGANAPRSRPPTALWGIQEGKADVTRCKTGARRTSSAATRALVPADPVT